MFNIMHLMGIFGDFPEAGLKTNLFRMSFDILK